MMKCPNLFKGQLKYLILKSLNKEPMHGYMLMKSISINCMNLWKPTPGSLYPALEELKKEKLIEVKSQQSTGRKKKIYFLTSIGKKKFLELSPQVNELEKKFLEFHHTEMDKHSFEDFVFMLNLMDSMLGIEAKKFRGSMIEFALLKKQGKISVKQEKELKELLTKLFDSIKKIITDSS